MSLRNAFIFLIALLLIGIAKLFPQYSGTVAIIFLAVGITATLLKLFLVGSFLQDRVASEARTTKKSITHMWLVNIGKTFLYLLLPALLLAVALTYVSFRYYR